MFTVCDRHLDRAIDEFVEVYEMPPDLYLLSDVTFTEWTAPPICNFCDLPPRYLVV